MTEREIVLSKLMDLWCQDFPVADDETPKIAENMFRAGLDALTEEQLHDLEKVMFDA